MRIYFKCQTYLKKNQAEQLCRVAEERGIAILDAAAYVSSLNGMVLGKCRGLATNLRSMVKESPSKALFRIENPMGYGEYLERNNIDGNKLYILKQLAYNEATLNGFLGRLGYLQELLKNSKSDYICPFILSTIHSSKGLEYDRVFLMDVFDGLFPAQVVRSSKKGSQSEVAAFEEERRLFYVGMTRAKNNLTIFRLRDASSCLIKEITTPVKKNTGVKADSAKTEATHRATVKAGAYKPTGKLVSDYDLTEGELVVSVQYGQGVVTNVEYDNSGHIDKFKVEFDNIGAKTFLFPIAFQNSMRLLSGEEVKIEVVQEKKPSTAEPSIKPKLVKPTVAKKTSGYDRRKNTYAYWALEYPDYVVIKREGAFWTCRGESAETLSEVLGYKLGGSADKPVTGSPNLDPMIYALKEHHISYIVVNDGEIVERKTFDGGIECDGNI